MPGARRVAPPGDARIKSLVELVLAALRMEPAYAVGIPEQLAMSAEASITLPGTSSERGRDERGRDERGRDESATSPPGGPRHAAVEDSHVETWQLVTAAQQGDGEAFGQLYDRYVDTVFRYIYYRVNDRAMAEDFTSETFLRALRRIGAISYQGRDIGAWFTTIARNIILDHVKSARHRLEMTTADVIERDETEPSPEAAVLSSLTTEHLMNAVRRLGDDQRECIVLRFMQGLSVSETAEIMGKNDGAIKALQHRAIRKLADLVGKELR